MHAKCVALIVTWQSVCLWILALIWPIKGRGCSCIKCWIEKSSAYDAKHQAYSHSNEGCEPACLMVDTTCCIQGQLAMEGALTARDRVGIQDFVLLDETTDAAFLSNLTKRFSKDLIYVSVRNVLICVHHNDYNANFNSIRPTLAHCWCRWIPTKNWTSTITNRWIFTWGSTFLSFHHTCEYENKEYSCTCVVFLVFLGVACETFWFFTQLRFGRQRLPHHADRVQQSLHPHLWRERSGKDRGLQKDSAVLRCQLSEHHSAQHRQGQNAHVQPGPWGLGVTCDLSLCDMPNRSSC